VDGENGVWSFHEEADGDSASVLECWVDYSMWKVLGMSAIKIQVDQVFESLPPEVLVAPEVFRDRDQLASPSDLGEWAMYVAAQREFVAEHLQEARHTLDLITAMQRVLAEETDDDLQVKLSEDAPVLINRSFAAQERMAHAKVSQVDRMVVVRAGQLQVDRLSAMVRQLDHVHREWRAAEFTIDRLVRITQMRLTISEV
jgi:hypothetical protein